jgi:hypothetical protein
MKVIDSLSFAHQYYAEKQRMFFVELSIDLYLNLFVKTSGTFLVLRGGSFYFGFFRAYKNIDKTDSDQKKR